MEGNDLNNVTICGQEAKKNLATRAKQDKLLFVQETRYSMAESTQGLSWADNTLAKFVYRGSCSSINWEK